MRLTYVSDQGVGPLAGLLVFFVLVLLFAVLAVFRSELLNDSAVVYSLAAGGIIVAGLFLLFAELSASREDSPSQYNR